MGNPTFSSAPKGISLDIPVAIKTHAVHITTHIYIYVRPNYKIYLQE
jgi:hypothetical protein